MTTILSQRKAGPWKRFQPSAGPGNERETRFTSGMERDRWDQSRSIRHQKISNLSPKILVEWIAPQAPRESERTFK